MAERNHQSFRDWLFSEEPLNPQQTQLLQEHLQECPDCCTHQESWRQVQWLLQRQPQATPAPGFANRWQERLLQERQKQQMRYAWGMFGITSGAAAVALLILGWQALVVLQAPAQLFVAAIYRLIRFAAVMDAMSRFLDSMVTVFPSISFLSLFFFTGFVSFLSVLWLVTYLQLSARRIMV